MRQEYYYSDQLQKQIDWHNIMKMERYAGGHDDQMRGLFKNVTVIGHYNDGDCQGRVATCVRFDKGVFKGKYAIYNDYYGSCSGCDAWEGATDEEVKSMCVNLSNSAYIFKSLDAVKAFLGSVDDYRHDWHGLSKDLLSEIIKFVP